MDDQRELEEEIRTRLRRDLRAISIAPYAVYRSAALARAGVGVRGLRTLGVAAMGLAAVAVALLLGSALGEVRRNALASPMPTPRATEMTVTSATVEICEPALQRVLALRSVVIRADRVEVKRMTIRDLRAGSGGQVDIKVNFALATTAPVEDDIMLCVVAVGGEVRAPDAPVARPPDRWGLFVSISATGAPVPHQFGSDGQWPPYFDALPTTK